VSRFVRQLGHLFGRRDVAAKERDAAEIELTGERSQLCWNPLALEASNEQLTDVTPDLTD
jgi:hypothetical protein